ncbi:hypothetical protein C8J56DRAFT_803618, partial [Mycena floridula]
VALLRGFQPLTGDHFYTTSAGEMESAVGNLRFNIGNNKEGTAGFVYTDANCGGSPLYHLFNVGMSDHFYTMSAGERDLAVASSYVFEGLLPISTLLKYLHSTYSH